MSHYTSVLKTGSNVSRAIQVLDGPCPDSEGRVGYIVVFRCLGPGLDDEGELVIRRFIVRWGFGRDSMIEWAVCVTLEELENLALTAVELL